MSSPKGGHFPSEGSQRKWGFPTSAERDATSPRCVVRVDWLQHECQGLREDLGPLAFAEYATGGPGLGGGRDSKKLVESKGVGGGQVTMFVSHPMDSKDWDSKDKTSFASRWIRQDESLRGEHRAKWSIENAWAVHILRRKLQAERYSRTPNEQRHFRIRLCPETRGGVFLRDSDRMEEFTCRFMTALERDYGGNFYWVAAAHYNTDQPHVHICLRGIDVQKMHVFFARSYLKASEIELQANSSASSPIEWRARNILGQMIREAKGARHAG